MSWVYRLQPGTTYTTVGHCCLLLRIGFVFKYRRSEINCKVNCVVELHLPLITVSSSEVVALNLQQPSIVPVVAGAIYVREGSITTHGGMNRSGNLPGNEGGAVEKRWLPLIPEVCCLHRTWTNPSRLSEERTCTHRVKFYHTPPDTRCAPLLRTCFSRSWRGAKIRGEVAQTYFRYFKINPANAYRFARGRLPQLRGFVLYNAMRVYIYKKRSSAADYALSSSGTSPG